MIDFFSAGLGLMIMIGLSLCFIIFFVVIATVKRTSKSISQYFPPALPQPQRDISTTAVAVIDPFNFSLPLHREVFTGVLIVGREYDITISGVVRDCLLVQNRFVSADAFYYEDYQGNFTKPHNSLSMDPKSVPHADLTSVDRELHHYTLRYNGDGKKLAFCFNARPTEDQYNQGSLYVSIQETATSIAARATVEAQECATAGKAEADSQARIQELIADQRHRPHLTDPGYLEKYAARHKDELLDDHDEIIQENLDFENNVIPVLKEQKREDLIPFGEWEIKALAIAEHLDVEPPASSPLPAARRKLTGEEHQANFERHREAVARWLRAKIEDGFMRARIKLEAVPMVDAMLDEHSSRLQYDLDPDERQRIRQELLDSIDNNLNEEDAQGQGYKRL